MIIKTLIALSIILNMNYSQSDFSQFGKVPADRAEIFAKNLFSSPDQEHSALSFSPDGKEIYWSIWELPYSKDKPQIILCSKYINGKWSEPKKVSFTGKYMDGSPVLSPDGNSLYFYSNRPYSGNGPARKDIDIWYVKRTQQGWGDPINLEKVNTPDGGEAPGSISLNGNLYFSRGIKKGSNPIPVVDIYVAEFDDGIFLTPKKLPDIINTDQHRENYPFISPDESYIIFASDQRVFSDEGKYINGERYLSISFKNNGRWTSPKKFDKNINGDGARFPSLSPDGNTLFVTRYTEGPNEDYYWINANVLKKYKAENLSNASVIKLKEKSPLPEVRRNHSVVQLENKIYVIGGRKKGLPERSTVYQYDPVGNNWEKKSDMPTPRSNFQLAVSDGKIYAIGGDPFLNTNEVFDPINNIWEKLHPMPTSRQHTAAAEYDGKIYVFGGLESWEKISNKNEMYDPAIGKWIEKSPLPVAKHGIMAVNINNKIYLVGGCGTEKSIWEMHSTVDVYDPVTDKWGNIADLPEPCLKPEITIVNKTIVAVTSFNAQNKSNIYKYCMEKNEWQKLGELPSLTRFSGIASIGERVFIIAGCDEKFNPYDTVYEFEIK